MKRASGVLMHVSSLWGKYSEGSFGEAAIKWIDYLAGCGFSYWQVLPFCLPDDYNSPYKSYSAFSVNPFFIDLDDLYRRGLLTADEVRGAEQKTPYSCEFDRLAAQRMPLIGRAAARFAASAKNREAENAFLESHPHTGAFCRFMALKEQNGGAEWRKWESTELTEEYTASLETWRFSQYIFHEQWKKIRERAKEKGISIIGDIPIYVALDSSDVWSDPGQFRLDADYEPTASAGVPPDYFSEDGQLWGNPLYDWDRMKADGYRWWRERMEFMGELFDGVRIDHFRGLESYFSIPAGEKTAKNGRWMPGPGLEFVTEMKKAAPEGFMIIAEDLGVITDEVRALVEDSGLPGMRVLQFAFMGDPGSPHLPHNYINNCVAYTGTHDNNTLLGYVWELDEGTRRRLMEYCGYADTKNWDACYDAVLRTMFASHAGLLILPVQDLLLYGSDTRLNTPGRCDGNWSYRITEEQLKNIDRDKFRCWNELYGRI